jgi:signal transduction histidine kinase
VRNPLTVIGGFARRAYEQTPEDEPKKRYLRIIMKEVEVLETRVAEIIKIEDKANIAV